MDTAAKHFASLLDQFIALRPVPNGHDASVDVASNMLDLIRQAVLPREYWATLHAQAPDGKLCDAEIQALQKEFHAPLKPTKAARDRLVITQDDLAAITHPLPFLLSHDERRRLQHSLQLWLDTKVNQ